MYDEFLEGMAEILEIDTLNEESKFDELDVVWDSLAIVSTIALLDQCFDVMIPGSQLAEVSSVNEILSLVESQN